MSVLYIGCMVPKGYAHQVKDDEKWGKRNSYKIFVLYPEGNKRDAS